MPKHDYASITVNKALDLLELVAEGGHPTLGRAAQALDLPKATAFRLLHTLMKRGFIIRAAVVGFGLGPRAPWLADRVKASWLDTLERAVEPHLLPLRDAYGDTVNLGIRSGTDLVYRASVEGTYPIRFVEAQGAVGPLRATALGKALLAYLTSLEQGRILGRLPLAALTTKTITAATDWSESLPASGLWVTPSTMRNPSKGRSAWLSRSSLVKSIRLPRLA